MWYHEQMMRKEKLFHDDCEYCQEDKEGFRKMFGSFSITNPFHKGEYFLNSGKSKPRRIHFCPMCGRKF